jgi:hypothetical protein
MAKTGPAHAGSIMERISLKKRSKKKTRIENVKFPEYIKKS